MSMRSGAENRRPIAIRAEGLRADALRGDVWPGREVPQHDQSHAEDSGSVIADMVSVLSTGARGSTAESLAFLRQLYPRYPLTLRLAALVAHSKVHPQPIAAERPVAQ